MKWFLNLIIKIPSMYSSNSHFNCKYSLNNKHLFEKNSHITVFITFLFIKRPIYEILKQLTY